MKKGLFFAALPNAKQGSFASENWFSERRIEMDGRTRESRLGAAGGAGGSCSPRGSPVAVDSLNRAEL